MPEEKGGISSESAGAQEYSVHRRRRCPGCSLERWSVRRCRLPTGVDAELCGPCRVANGGIRPTVLMTLAERSAEVDAVLADVAKVATLETGELAAVTLCCPWCQRGFTEAQWAGLSWLQYAGAVRSSGVLRAVEVRRCACNQPIGREVEVPLAQLQRAG